jgi:NAD+ synthase
MQGPKNLEKISARTKKFFQAAGFEQAVFGLSGGLDSSTLAFVLARALKPENIWALSMPESSLALKRDLEDVKMVVERTGINLVSQPIDKFVNDFAKVKWSQNPLAEINTKARVRMLLLYNFANTKTALVVGTSNKSEILLGYGTKFGDTAADLWPFKDILKTDLKEVARAAGVPERIITKTPSAGLYRGQTDEKELGAPYEKLDAILAALERGEPLDDLKAKFPPELLANVIERVEKNRHKSVALPV